MTIIIHIYTKDFEMFNINHVEWTMINDYKVAMQIIPNYFKNQQEKYDSKMPEFNNQSYLLRTDGRTKLIVEKPCF